MKIVPGKMNEAMEFMKEWAATIGKSGAPSFKCYQCLSGRDEYMHTIICEIEWESFSAMEDYLDKMMTDKDIQKQNTKWEDIIDYHWVEFLTPMSI
jgi:hypothetical protein